MNEKLLTILYAYRNADTAPDLDLSAQTLSSEKIDVLPVLEDDIYHNRACSLRKIPSIQSKYTICLDEEDLFDSSFLAHLCQVLEETDTAFAMPSQIGQLVTRPTEYFSLSDSSDQIFDVELSAPVFPTELHGVMFRTETLQKACAICVSPYEPQKQILLSLLSENPRYYYAGSTSLRYAFPRECDYQFNLCCLSREWYFEPFTEFLLPLLEKEAQNHHCILPFFQYLALHMMHIREYANLNNRDKHVLSLAEVPDYGKLFTRILSYIDVRTIFSPACNLATSDKKTKFFDLRLKMGDFHYYPDLAKTTSSVHMMCGNVEVAALSSIPVQIMLIDYKNGNLEIDGNINDYFSDADAGVCAVLGNVSIPLVYNNRYSLTKCFGLGFEKKKTFHVSIPVSDCSSEQLLRFYLCFNGNNYPLEYAFPGHTSRFTKDFPSSYWRFGPYLAYWTKQKIHIVKATKLMVLKRELKLWRQIYKKHKEALKEPLHWKICSFLLRPYFSKKKIWLFFDKIYKGGDSSEYIYRYACAQNDGIKKYYLLDKSVPDYQRLKKEGYRPLIRGSLKHRLIFLNANMIIVSNSTVFAFNDYTANRSLVARGDVHFDVACVQHGMSVQKIAIAQNRLRDNTKLYFCASKYEIANLSHPVYDYNGYDALHLTGVPRYDGLKDRAEKVLLFSPTWRMQSALPVTKNEGVARDYNPNFKETNYYKVYNGLMNDSRLLDAARKYGYRIKYVLHPIVSPQYEDFTKNEFVDIIPATGDMSYEKIFCESALMVTDFSGVQFDFAYMRKPVVYLHHNDIPQHYEEGSFHYTTMGFGEICHTNEELITVLCEYMKHDCKMPDLYRRRADDFFAFSDHNNCERIYKVMLEHEKNRET